MDKQATNASLAEYHRQQFTGRLERSRLAVMRVAEWFFMRGYSIKATPPEMTPTYRERFDFTDDGDLWIGVNGNDKRVEVKFWQRNTFTSLDDFPFDYIFVCAKHAWDKAIVKPCWFVTVNPELGYMGFVRGSTFHYWQLFSYSTTNYQGRDEIVYRCPKNLIEFRKMKT